MKLKIVLFVFCMPCLLWAQNTHADKYQSIKSNKGINWVNAANWEEVKSLAKRENKYIFVDCYTTWCQPCKLMDKDVYESEKVGQFLSENFVSVKIQMDKAKNDNGQVKSWYEDADKLAEQYKVTSYPSFLFFSPNGLIVHKQTGYKSVKNFVQICSDALDINKQYYTLFNRYKQNTLDASSTRTLARMCKSFGENELALEIANNYLGKLGSRALEILEDKSFLLEFKKSDNALRIANDYVDMLTQEDMYKKENIEFTTYFMGSTKSKSFRFFYNHRWQIDSIMNKKGYAVNVIDYVIDKEEISPYWDAAINEKGIDWKKIYNSLEKKYGNDYADRIILNSKIFLYKYLAEKSGKYWDDFLKYAIEKVKKYKSDTSDFWQENDLNEVAWYVFLYSCNKRQLSAALKWMEAVVNRHPDAPAFLDTYANLLYKFGRKKDAIAIEEKAYEKSKYGESFKQTLIKMKKGEPTWIY